MAVAALGRPGRMAVAAGPPGSAAVAVLGLPGHMAVAAGPPGSAAVAGPVPLGHAHGFGIGRVDRRSGGGSRPWQRGLVGRPGQ